MASYMVIVAAIVALVVISSTDGRGIPSFEFGARRTQQSLNHEVEGEQRPVDWESIVIPGQPNINMCPSHMQSDCHYDPCSGMACGSVDRAICMTERCNGCRPKFFTVSMGPQMLMNWNDVTYKCDL